MLTGDKAQLLPPQACWGGVYPCFSNLPPAPARLLEREWAACPQASHFTCHNGEMNRAARGPPRSSLSVGLGSGLSQTGHSRGFRSQDGEISKGLGPGSPRTLHVPLRLLIFRTEWLRLLGSWELPLTLPSGGRDE